MSGSISSYVVPTTVTVPAQATPALSVAAQVNQQFNRNTSNYMDFAERLEIPHWGLVAVRTDLVIRLV